MTKQLIVAVAAALSLNVLAAAYGAAAAGQSARATCTQRHGTVRGDECVRDGHNLLPVPR